MSKDVPIEVYIAANSHEAHMVKDALERAGILAQVVGEHLLGAVEFSSAVENSPRIWVKPDDVEKAKKIIAGYVGRREAVGRTEERWYCPGCGEWNAASFDICWHCYRGRPA